MHRIHQSPNDIMADNSDKTLSAIQRSIDVGEKNNRKLEEIKSASLVTNNHLRKIVKKEVQKMDITNLDNLSVLVGRPGKTPVKGVDYYTPKEITEFKKEVTPIKGKDYRDGTDGITPKKGVDYFDGTDAKTPEKGKDYFTAKEIKEFKKEVTPVKGKDYRDGVDGVTPKKGVDYNDGKDSIPDTPAEVVAKVNASRKKIDPKQVRGLLEALRVVDQFGSNPQGAYASGGANQMRIQDEGVSVSDHITALNFIGAGVSATYTGDGVIAVTITGTATNFADNETPTGTINGTNKVFTLAGTPSPAGSLSVYLNGALQQAGGGDYTLVTNTITFINAPLTGSILLCWYRYA